MEGSSVYFGIGVALFGALLGASADRFSYWFHVSRGMLWKKYCLNCFSYQKWITYFPILGRIINRGTCLVCKEKLPLATWIAEIIGAVVFLGVWYVRFVGAQPRSLEEWIILSLLTLLVFSGIVLGISDAMYDELPMAVVIVAGGALLALASFVGAEQVYTTLIGAALGGIIMSILHVLSNWKWVHRHDIVLGVLVGGLVGFPGFFITLAFTYIFAVMGGLASWGWTRPVPRGVSSFGLYLFAALTLQGILSASQMLNV